MFLVIFVKQSHWLSFLFFFCYFRYYIRKAFGSSKWIIFLEGKHDVFISFLSYRRKDFEFQFYLFYSRNIFAKLMYQKYAASTFNS